MPTKIEWCDETINPIVGCSKISEGCQNCYAEKMAWRLKCMGNPKYQDVVDRNGWTGKMMGCFSQFYSLPKKPKRVFVCSMGDLFHEHINDGPISMVFYAMRDYPQHTYMILTKRPDRMAYFLERKISPNCIKGIPSLWFGVTVENQKRADECIPILLQIRAQIRAAVLFVSVEPMLEPVNLLTLREDLPLPAHFFYLDHLDWVIAGPETGPGKRECKPEWIRDLYHQCREINVPFFDKSKNNWMAREFPK